MPGWSSRSPVRMPAPSLYERSLSHCGLSDCATYCACALATRTMASEARTTADEAKALLVIGVGEGTPIYGSATAKRSGLRAGRGGGDPRGVLLARARGYSVVAGHRRRRTGEDDRIGRGIVRHVLLREVVADLFGDLSLPDESHFFPDALVGLGRQLLGPLP